MKHLRFRMMYSFYGKDKENTEDVKLLGSMHPQKAMKELGITYTNATPQRMGDQWWFWNCESLPDNLPPFLTEMQNDPMEMIGYGLNQKEAESIRDYKAN